MPLPGQSYYPAGQRRPSTSSTVPHNEILEVTAQSLLKPGIFGPSPILLQEVFVLIKAAVRFALRQDELPLAYLIFMMMSSREQFL